MTVDIGAISFSIWGLIKASAVFIVLWAAGSAARRFFAHWLSASTHLTYSDRVLIQRLFNVAIVTLVLLVSLHAARIHMTAIAFTGGVIGIAIGMGLQKRGANLVSGIHLLLSKPIRQGDVITLSDTFSGASCGWVTRIGMFYVHVATRDGTEHLVPNDIFLTQKIDGPVKSKESDSFVKTPSSRRANLSGVRRTYVRRNDFEMQRNAEIGFFTELSKLKIYLSATTACAFA
jgi:small-conductance mechanosensitive channel